MKAPNEEEGRSASRFPKGAGMLSREYENARACELKLKPTTIK